MVREKTMVVREIIYFEQGWSYVETGITKLKRILEGLSEPEFDSEHYTKLYTTVYHMSTQEPPHDYSQQLYEKYREAFEEFINSSVLPDLREKRDEYLRKELVRRWSNHKVTVYNELHSEVKDAVIALVNKEREGGQIDKTLLKNVLEIYVEIAVGKMKRYEEDFGSFMLQDTSSYYSHKASSWIQEDSCPDYMLKSEACIKEEKERVTHYLHSSSVPKLVEALKESFEIVNARSSSGEHAT